MNYTTIEQSKNLLDLGLSPKTADMCYVINYAESNKYGTDHFNLEVDIYGFKVQEKDNIPCWSLGALLEVMPKPININESFCYPYVDTFFRAIVYMCGGAEYKREIGKNTLEAAYNTVVWLLENGYIKTEKK